MTDSFLKPIYLQHFPFTYSFHDQMDPKGHSSTEP